MDFAALPPEINSARMYAGPGSGPLMAAATSWHSLAAELASAADDYGSIVSNLTTGPWRGPASASMVAAAAPYVTWMGTAATQALQTGSQAKAAAGAYDTGFAMTVPPPVIAANRSLLMSLIATNFLGQNTPAIAATEAHYAEMWAQDAAAMYGYAGSSAAASALTPFTEPPATTTTEGPALQATAIAQAAGTATPTTLSQLTSAIPQALQGLASPTSTSSTSGFGGILRALGLGGTDPSSPGGLLDWLANSPLGFNSNLWNTIFSSGFYMPGNWLGTFTDFAGLTGGAGAAAEAAEGALGAAAADGLGSAGLGSLGGLGGLSGLGGVAAGLGQAGSIGALSAPPNWTAPIGAAASTVPSSGMGAAPAFGAGGPASMLGGMPLTGPFANGVGSAPKYGFRPTVVAHPPAAG
ncbi:hypothetical protein AN480_28490 (plasmid) [Mycobacterium intracellulare subsp. chimaera]|uniref:PPE family protein n=1 Tax=Mycobacterium intracellulare TaxID=1767 RepID=UPI0008593B21|nr:PPE family protein [Mycobacterium intracellulare]AOS94981.1 hypothetical protein AN480_28490 [Mycobacterium intracellulare subsp. chimaera]